MLIYSRVKLLCCMLGIFPLRPAVPALNWTSSGGLGATNTRSSRQDISRCVLRNGNILPIFIPTALLYTVYRHAYMHRCNFGNCVVSQTLYVHVSFTSAGSIGKGHSFISLDLWHGEQTGPQ